MNIFAYNITYIIYTIIAFYSLLSTTEGWSFMFYLWSSPLFLFLILYTLMATVVRLKQQSIKHIYINKFLFILLILLHIVLLKYNFRDAGDGIKTPEMEFSSLVATIVFPLYLITFVYLSITSPFKIK